MSEIRARLSAEAERVLREQFGVATDVMWVPSSAGTHGDFATAVAMKISRDRGCATVDVAEPLAAHLRSVDGVARADVAGNGYVNVWLTPAALLRELRDMRQACTPAVTRVQENPVIVDYSSPNIAKPLGIHHLLSTVIGQVLVNLHRHAGYPVVAWNYLGDWGTQFGKLAVAMERWGEGKSVRELKLSGLLALYVKFHEAAEADPEIEDAARVAFKHLESGDARMRAFWADAVAVTKESVAPIYARLHVGFDCERGESTYEDRMAPIVSEGRRRGVFREGEKGALIVAFPADSALPPAVVLKADGATTYLTRDLALLHDRMEQWHPAVILHVVDTAQALYFRQLFSAATQLQWDVPRLEHVAFGRMRFADGNMSTRAGKVLGLEDVLDEAVRRAQTMICERGALIQTDDPATLAEMMGVGAVVYGILSQNRKMDFVFNWAKSVTFEGNSAPYLQYTHARACSVLRKASATDPEFPVAVADFTTHERTLIMLLLQFSSVLVQAREERLPHLLAQYLYALCQQYNAFYNVDPILTANEPQRSFRLALTACAAAVLRCGAELLTLRVPDRM